VRNADVALAMDRVVPPPTLAAPNVVTPRTGCLGGKKSHRSQLVVLP
jgi:hypothetical protein